MPLQYAFIVLQRILGNVNNANIITHGNNFNVKINRLQFCYPFIQYTETRKFYRLTHNSKNLLVFIRTV